MSRSIATSEPSMEDILASIRKIIAEDPPSPRPGQSGGANALPAAPKMDRTLFVKPAEQSPLRAPSSEVPLQDTTSREPYLRPSGNQPAQPSAQVTKHVPFEPRAFPSEHKSTQPNDVMRSTSLPFEKTAQPVAHTSSSVDDQLSDLLDDIFEGDAGNAAEPEATINEVTLASDTFRAADDQPGLEEKFVAPASAHAAADTPEADAPAHIARQRYDFSQHANVANIQQTAFAEDAVNSVASATSHETPSETSASEAVTSINSSVTALPRAGATNPHMTTLSDPVFRRRDRDVLRAGGEPEAAKPVDSVAPSPTNAAAAAEERSRAFYDGLRVSPSIAATLPPHNEQARGSDSLDRPVFSQSMDALRDEAETAAQYIAVQVLENPVMLDAFQAPHQVHPSAAGTSSPEPSTLSIRSVASTSHALVNRSFEDALPPMSSSMEDTVADLLRPMLKSWLAENMPKIVERALRREISELSHGHHKSAAE